MNPAAAAAIAEVTRLVERYGASSHVRAWLAEQRRAAAVLVFREAGADAAGRRQFQVGDASKPDRLVTFVPKNAGIEWLWLAVKNQPGGVAVTGKAADATRKLYGRALDELDDHSPGLANELRRNCSPAGGAMVYSPAVSSPKIVTEGAVSKVSPV